MRFRRTVIALAAITLGWPAGPGAFAETRTAEAVFHKWLGGQVVRADVAPAAVGAALDAAYVARLRTGVPRAILPQVTFLKLPPGPAAPPAPGPAPRSRPPSAAETDACLAAVRGVYALLDADFDAFVALLERSGFGTAALDRVDRQQRPAVKYRPFLAALLDRDPVDGEPSRALAFAVANRAFEWSFRPATYARLRALIAKPAGRAIVRLLYELMRHFLARTGWAHWHEQALAGLAREHARGREIVYVGGGADLYQLIRHGLYRVRFIDPMLPTQTPYYAEGWDYLAKGAGRDGGIGDEIVFGKAGPGPKVTLRRTSYVEQGTLTEVMVPRPGRKTGVKTAVPRSTTGWTILDAGGKTVGAFTLERRFAVDADFRPDRAMLMSINELNYVVSTRRDNWSLNPRGFDKGVVIHVKQLRAPVDWATLQNLRAVQDSELPFTFGSNVY
jgi:hypothetical protein